MRVFVINLDRSKDRWEYFKDTGYTRWSATDRHEVKQFYLNKMISYYNIKEENHKGKCGCFMSHLLLWKYIIDNKIDDVLILEDDAQKIKDIPDLPQDGLTYLGGLLFQNKITEGTYKGDHNFNDINLVNDFKLLMTMSYYIPKYEIVKKLYDFINNKKRWRAIDIMLNYNDLPIKRYFVYPSIFIERQFTSTIDSKGTLHNKLCDEHYRWIKRSNIKQSNIKRNSS